MSKQVAWPLRCHRVYTQLSRGLDKFIFNETALSLVKGPGSLCAHGPHKHRTLWLRPTDRGIIYWSYANFTAGPRGKSHQKDPTRARFCVRAYAHERADVCAGKTNREYERERRQASAGARERASVVFGEYYAPELEFPNNEIPREPHERPRTTSEEKKG